MIFGENFGRLPIPPGMIRAVPERINVEKRELTPHVIGRDWPNPKYKMARRVGCATTKNDVIRMLMQASNGHRTLFVLDCSTDVLSIFGVYVW